MRQDRRVGTGRSKNPSISRRIRYQWSAVRLSHRTVDQTGVTNESSCWRPDLRIFSQASGCLLLRAKLLIRWLASEVGVCATTTRFPHAGTVVYGMLYSLRWTAAEQVFSPIDARCILCLLRAVPNGESFLKIKLMPERPGRSSDNTRELHHVCREMRS